jgi:rhamnosyltransferase
LSSRISAIVVLYHPAANVADHIRTYSSVVEKVFVIDNSDRVDEPIIQTVKSITNAVYVSNGGNRGIAHALNVGIELSVRENFTHVLTMDQDSWFETGYAGELIKALDKIGDVKAGIIAPLYNTRVASQAGDQIFMERRAVITSGNLLSLAAVAACGYLDEKLFIDSVDHEYCLRIRTHGFKILQYTGVSLSHSLGNLQRDSITKVTTTHHDAIRRYYITRNRLAVSRKYFRFDPVFCSGEIWLVIRDFFKVLLFENDKKMKMSNMLKGLRDFFVGRFGKMKL